MFSAGHLRSRDRCHLLLLWAVIFATAVSATVASAPVASASTGTHARTLGTWFEQAAPRHLDHLQLQSISCARDGRHCLALGRFCSGYPCTTPLKGALLATANSGATWRRLPMPSASWFSAINPGEPGESAGAISCASARDCVALGVHQGTPGPYGAIFMTKSGGASWSVFNASAAGIGDVTGISCPTVTTCFVVAGRGQNGAAFLTTDGGARWTSIPVPQRVFFLAAISCSSAIRCVAVGSTLSDRAISIATNDRGTHWTLHFMPRGIAGLVGLSCPAAKLCYAVADPLGAYPGMIVATKNGGATWHEQSSYQLELLTGISCSSSSTCVAVGAGFYQGVIVTTRTGGRHWQLRPQLRTSARDRNELLAVSCTTTVRCIAVGDLYKVDISRDVITDVRPLILANYRR